MSKCIKCSMCGCDNDAGEMCFVCGSNLVAAKAVKPGRIKLTEADKLTRKYTTYSTFAEFEFAMSGGYTPTIRRTNKAYDAKGRKSRTVKGRVRLIELVRLAGFQVFDGSKTLPALAA